MADHEHSGRGVVRIPYPIGIREAAVVRKEWVNEQMLRITLGGHDLAETHTYAADDHVKLIFPDDSGRLRLPITNDHDMLDWPRPSPPTRCYTIRRYDPAAAELDLDFVIHTAGLATDWARTVPIGATIPIAGPPGGKVFPLNYQHYVFAVDSTGLPAVARWLEETSPSAAAHSVDVIVVVDHTAQQTYPLDHPHIRLQWLKPNAEDLASAVDVTIRGFTTIPDTHGTAAGAGFDRTPSSPSRDPADRQRVAQGSTSRDNPNHLFLFAAGEADLIKPLRRLARSAGIDHSITGYWKQGEADFDD